MTVIEWAFQNPGRAVSLASLVVVWLMLAIPGLWVWTEYGLIPLKQRWRSNWRLWPRLNFMESLFVSLFMMLLWLLWLRVFLYLVGVQA